MEDTTELGYHQRRANVVRRASVDQLDSLVVGQVEGHLAMALVSSAKGGRSLYFLVVKRKVTMRVKESSRFVLALLIPALRITMLGDRRLWTLCCSAFAISKIRLQGRRR
jgi:hypothetical protein